MGTSEDGFAAPLSNSATTGVPLAGLGRLVRDRWGLTWQSGNTGDGSLPNSIWSAPGSVGLSETWKGWLWADVLGTEERQAGCLKNTQFSLVLGPETLRRDTLAATHSQKQL